MGAGGPGDHPLTDILNFNIPVYNTECDDLIKQISKLVTWEQLYKMFDWWSSDYTTESQLKIFKAKLAEKLEELKTGNV